ncbi:MAG: tetratricopeptide repeat protein [Chitinophagaceae bacterium]|nr:tetratricopeptide repeat protein [Chitinophagaceae bacterium]
MADNKTTPLENSEVAVAKAKDFWTKNSKMILGVGGGLLVLVIGFYVYRNFFQKPKEEKAMASLYKAEEYYRMDSANLALNGDGSSNPGLLTIINKYSGTKAANLAHFYAGACYIQLDDNDNAIKHLKDFSSESKQVQQRAYLLLGDAYADKGEHKQALDYYKKSANHFVEDENASAEALFRAAAIAEVLNDNAEAVKLYTQLKEKYRSSPRGQEVDVYLAKLGALNVD